jgi:uncharacterized protein (TIGR00661 family)
MKVLYAIQATGNGHISRANEIIPFLEDKCELDVLLSGTQSNIELDYFIRYRRKGLSFEFGKNGGIDFMASLQKLQSKRFLQEVRSFPIEQYDLVINDFEPISAWACRTKNIPCIAMSHQYAVLHKGAPRPTRPDPLAWLLLKYYAPCSAGIGFHFKSYGEELYTPVIRKAIRHAYVRNLGHYTVYLPAYEESKLVKLLSKFKDIQWHIFSRDCKRSYGEGNCFVRPVNVFDFTSSFTNCEGIICGAGFETPAEALFLGKKLLVIPMKHQFEQHCNAAALKEMGVPVIKSLKKKQIPKINTWLLERNTIQVNYKDETAMIVDRLLAQVTMGYTNENLQDVAQEALEAASV